MKWIRLWVKETIMGTTFQELDAQERGIWFSLLVMSASGLTPGIVELRKGVPWDHSALAKYINVPEGIFEITIKLLQRVEKIKILEDGRIQILNFEKYQTRYEKYYKADIEAEEEADNMAHVCQVDKKEKEKENRSRLKEKNDPIPSEIKIIFDPETREFKNINSEDIKTWTQAYPACDIQNELREMISWLMGDWPARRKIKWKRFIQGWLAREQDKGGTRIGHRYMPDQSGIDKKQPTKKEISYKIARDKKIKSLQAQYRPNYDAAVAAGNKEALEAVLQNIKEEMATWSQEWHKRRKNENNNQTNL